MILYTCPDSTNIFEITDGILNQIRLLHNRSDFSFVKRFTEIKRVIAFFQMTENSNETVLEYLSTLRKTATLNETLDENMLLAIATYDFKPEIKKTCHI